MKKILITSLIVGVVGTAVVLSTPKGREFVKKYVDEFTRNYREQEEKLYDVFAPSDDEIAQAKAHGKHA